MMRVNRLALANPRDNAYDAPSEKPLIARWVGSIGSVTKIRVRRIIDSRSCGRWAVRWAVHVEQPSVRVRSAAAERIVNHVEPRPVGLPAHDLRRARLHVDPVP